MRKLSQKKTKVWNSELQSKKLHVSLSDCTVNSDNLSLSFRLFCPFCVVRGAPFRPAVSSASFSELNLWFKD